MRNIAVITLLVLTFGFSEASAGVVISDVYVEAGIFSREYNTFWVSAPAYAGTDWGIPVGSGTSSVNRTFLANKSSVSFDFQEHVPNATVDFAWDHSIAGVTVDKDYGDEAYGYAWVFFTPDVDLRYELSGQYAVNGNATSYQFTSLETDTGLELFRSSKQSRSTPNETLVVGSLIGGDFTNRGNGSLTGDLNAGQTYTLYSIWYLHAYSDAPPSHATGDLRLSLSPRNTAAVPEPSSLLLLGIGVCGLFVHGRRGKRRNPGSEAI